MWKAALEILSSVLRLVLRRKAINDDPNNKNLARKAEYDKAIARGDGDALNRQLHDDLRRVRNPKGGSGAQ